MKHRKEHIQYVFIDVAGFTKPDRTVEQMVAIIESLNGIVKEVIGESGIAERDIILIPTGDGMCIALLNQGAEDRHMLIAEAIREHVEMGNLEKPKETGEYRLHISVHEGKDIVIIDIKGNDNIIGAGINKAARLMGECLPGNIVVSTTVYEGISRYAAYKGVFTPGSFTDKSGESHSYYKMGEGSGVTGRALLRLLELAGKRIGPPLGASDIQALQVGDFIFHKVYGKGKIKAVAPANHLDRWRRVTIDFRAMTYPVNLSNETGNYFKWAESNGR